MDQVEDCLPDLVFAKIFAAALLPSNVSRRGRCINRC